MEQRARFSNDSCLHAQLPSASVTRENLATASYVTGEWLFNLTRITTQEARKSGGKLEPSREEKEELPRYGQQRRLVFSKNELEEGKKGKEVSKPREIDGGYFHPMLAVRTGFLHYFKRRGKLTGSARLCTYSRTRALVLRVDVLSLAHARLFLFSEKVNRASGRCANFRALNISVAESRKWCGGNERCVYVRVGQCLIHVI